MDETPLRRPQPAQRCPSCVASTPRSMKIVQLRTAPRQPSRFHPQCWSSFLPLAQRAGHFIALPSDDARKHLTLVFTAQLMLLDARDIDECPQGISAEPD